jgi:hypothetical protein
LACETASCATALMYVLGCAEIVSFLVHNGHGCFAASLVPAAALQSFLGYNETRGSKFERNQLFTDFWMTVAQASQEVERLLCVARRHAEVAVAGLHSAGLRDETAVLIWLRKYGRNEGERIRLQEMLDRMGVGVGARDENVAPAPPRIICRLTACAYVLACCRFCRADA